MVNEARCKSLLVKGDPEDALGEANLVIVPSRFLRNKSNRELIAENMYYAEAVSSYANSYSCIYKAKGNNTETISVYTLYTGMPNPDDILDEIYNEVNEQIEDIKKRRKELKRKALCNQAKCRALDFDPNNIDFDDSNII